MQKILKNWNIMMAILQIKIQIIQSPQQVVKKK